MTPVVNQTMPVRDLVEVVLSTTGKDLARVSEVLLRGAVVQGASRYRWESLKAGQAELSALLRTFPDPDPSRVFRADACIGVRFRLGRQVIEVPRKIASERRLLKRRSFWDTVIALVDGAALEYLDYSYRLRADEYRLVLTRPDVEVLKEAARLLRYSTLITQMTEASMDSLDYLVHYP